MEILENIKLPIEGIVNLNMWMYFFKDRYPNSAMVMNTETGEYFIVNHRRNSHEILIKGNHKRWRCK